MFHLLHKIVDKLPIHDKEKGQLHKEIEEAENGGSAEQSTGSADSSSSE